MIIVSDTSVITNIIQIGQENLLPLIFNRVVIPEGVYQELLSNHTELGTTGRLEWLEVKKTTESDLYRKLRVDLDLGETEAIALAIELQADLLLIDERKGRQIAKEHGLIIVGLLGVLVRAKDHGLIDAIKPLMDRLIYEIDFRVSPALYRQILMDQGEM